MTSPNGRGEHTEGEEPVSGSGWVTTKRASAALGVAPRTIRDYIRSGKLTGRPEGEGVEKTWYVSIDSIYALREERRQKARGTDAADRRVEEALTDDLAGEIPGEPAAEGAAERGGGSASAPTPPNHTDILCEALLRLDSRAAEVGDLRARLELTAQAESTFREALEREQAAHERERERADRLEQEISGLREEAADPGTRGSSALKGTARTTVSTRPGALAAVRRTLAAKKSDVKMGSPLGGAFRYRI